MAEVCTAGCKKRRSSFSFACWFHLRTLLDDVYRSFRCSGEFAAIRPRTDVAVSLLDSIDILICSKGDHQNVHLSSKGPGCFDTRESDRDSGVHKWQHFLKGQPQLRSAAPELLEDQVLASQFYLTPFTFNW